MRFEFLQAKSRTSHFLHFFFLPDRQMSTRESSRLCIYQSISVKDDSEENVPFFFSQLWFQSKCETFGVYLLKESVLMSVHCVDMSMRSQRKDKWLALWQSCMRAGKLLLISTVPSSGHTVLHVVLWNSRCPWKRRKENQLQLILGRSSWCELNLFLLHI